tara:strand:+ start:512 stop:1822 length:1311 start_codon:yes stop_codon:yes gene_type:complete
MKMNRKWLAAMVIALVPFAAIAQLSIPNVGRSLPLPNSGFDDITKSLIDPVTSTVDAGMLDQLSMSELKILLNRLRVDRLDQFLRQNEAYVERDANGDPAVRGVLVATGMSEASLQRAQQEGFQVLERETIKGLDLNFVKLAVRQGKKLKSEQKKLQKIASEAEISADNIYFPSNLSSTTYASPLPTMALASGNAKSGALGLIDGGVARHKMITMAVEQRGFAKDAPTASSHATAIASLLSANPGISGRGLLAADIYGRDPAGGNATAIARALGWMVERHISVVTISLVGPNNGLLKNAISAAQKKGLLIVAAVGNDGPAAPQRFPASYLGVIGVTGVDQRQRALPEAGIATPVDFAAPGADIKGAALDGSMAPLRGTSFAAPLVAARLASYYPAPSITNIKPAINGLLKEAKDLGKKGPDKIYGNGLICGNCGIR